MDLLTHILSLFVFVVVVLLIIGLALSVADFLHTMCEGESSKEWRKGPFDD